MTVLTLLLQPSHSYYPMPFRHKKDWQLDKATRSAATCPLIVVLHEEEYHWQQLPWYQAAVAHGKVLQRLPYYGPAMESDPAYCFCEWYVKRAAASMGVLFVPSQGSF